MTFLDLPDDLHADLQATYTALQVNLVRLRYYYGESGAANAALDDKELAQLLFDSHEHTCGTIDAFLRIVHGFETGKLSHENLEDADMFAMVLDFVFGETDSLAETEFDEDAFTAWLETQHVFFRRTHERP